MEMWGLQRQCVIKWLQVTGEILSDMKREFCLTVCVTLTWSWTSRAESRISGSRVRSRWSGSLRAPGPTARPDTTPWCYDCETPTASCASPDRENIICYRVQKLTLCSTKALKGQMRIFIFLCVKMWWKKKNPPRGIFLEQKTFWGKILFKLYSKSFRIDKKKKKKNPDFFSPWRQKKILWKNK